MQNAVTMRERQLNVRLGPEEGVRFDAVAAHYGLNPQALVRMLVKREADALGVAPAESAKGARTSSKLGAKKK